MLGVKACTKSALPKSYDTARILAQCRAEQEGEGKCFFDLCMELMESSLDERVAKQQKGEKSTKKGKI